MQVTNKETSTTIPISGHDYNTTADFYIIFLSASLVSGKEYEIYIEFVAPVSTEQLDGLYLAQFTLPGSTEVK
jgi:hypothetical protein